MANQPRTLKELCIQSCSNDNRLNVSTSSFSPCLISEVGSSHRLCLCQVKLNVDDAFDADLSHESVRAVIHGNNGEMIVAGNKQIEWCPDVI